MKKAGGRGEEKERKINIYINSSTKKKKKETQHFCLREYIPFSITTLLSSKGNKFNLLVLWNNHILAFNFFFLAIRLIDFNCSINLSHKPQTGKESNRTSQ
jgi:hypothetical protein